MSAWKSNNNDPRIDGIASAIRVVPNFPKPGIMFKDITTLLLDPMAFKNTVDLFVERFAGKGIDVVAGVEARGFIFGPPIALAIGAKFIPLRKPRKLPAEVISEKYVLEYGSDCLEMHVGAVKPGEHALIVDDLVATGGTLCAAVNLLDTEPQQPSRTPTTTTTKRGNEKESSEHLSGKLNTAQELGDPPPLWPPAPEPFRPRRSTRLDLRQRLQIPSLPPIQRKPRSLLLRRPSQKTIAPLPAVSNADVAISTPGVM